MHVWFPSFVNTGLCWKMWTMAVHIFLGQQRSTETPVKLKHTQIWEITSYLQALNILFALPRILKILDEQSQLIRMQILLFHCFI